MQYRLFVFNGGRHIQRSHEFEAEDDEAAIDIAEGRREECPTELWQRDRCVKRWESR